MRRWYRRALVAVSLAMVLAAAAVEAGAADSKAAYYPGPGKDWERRAPGQVGMDGALLEAAAKFARANETAYPPALAKVADVRNLEQKLGFDWAGEPNNALIGPTKPRGDMSGIVVRHGYVVTEWGPTDRVDMTFSVTKTFLSSVAGLAHDRGLIRDVHDPVRNYVATGHFDSGHNAKITWDHLLRQTSNWKGRLWGKDDWADRPGDKPWGELIRPLDEPGTRWKYNDVRVNVLAFALLHIWRRPLPEVLKEEIMDPIGASPTWRWHGYENSWVMIDGKRMQSVSGGGHAGGGMFISAFDLARLGYLALRRGQWKDRGILSREWIKMARTPTSTKPTYGFMNWFLNTDGELLPSAPHSAFYFAGSGSNIVYVDEENDLVVVVRWIDRKALDGFFQRVLAAIR